MSQSVKIGHNLMLQPMFDVGTVIPMILNPNVPKWMQVPVFCHTCGRSPCTPWTRCSHSPPGSSGSSSVGKMEEGGDYEKRRQIWRRRTEVIAS